MLKITKQDNLIAGIKVLAEVVWLISAFCLGVVFEKSKIHIIKDPIIVYENMQAEPINRQGVIGVVSESQLKNIMGIKEAVPVKD